MTTMTRQIHFVRFPEELCAKVESFFNGKLEDSYEFPPKNGFGKPVTVRRPPLRLFLFDLSEDKANLTRLSTYLRQSPKTNWNIVKAILYRTRRFIVCDTASIELTAVAKRTKTVSVIHSNTQEIRKKFQLNLGEMVEDLVILGRLQAFNLYQVPKIFSIIVFDPCYLLRSPYDLLFVQDDDTRGFPSLCRPEEDVFTADDAKSRDPGLENEEVSRITRVFDILLMVVDNSYSFVCSTQHVSYSALKFIGEGKKCCGCSAQSNECGFYHGEYKDGILKHRFYLMTGRESVCGRCLESYRGSEKLGDLFGYHYKLGYRNLVQCKTKELLKDLYVTEKMRIVANIRSRDAYKYPMITGIKGDWYFCPVYKFVSLSDEDARRLKTAGKKIR